MDTVILTNLNEYVIYGSFAEGNEYIGGQVGPANAKWEAAATTDDDRKKSFNSATVLLNRQRYVAGLETMADRDALLVDGRYPFREASYELAGALWLDPTLFTAVTSGSNIKRVGIDGGPSVSYFQDTLGISGRFPINIQELIGLYLAGAEGGEISGSAAFGTTGQTSIAGEATGYRPYDLNGSSTLPDNSTE